MAARKPIVRKLTVYNSARQELQIFEDNYLSIIVDCSTPKGMKSAKDCRKEIRDARSNLEDLRKETKAPFIAKGTQVDVEAKVIKVKLDNLFTKFDSAIKAIENAKEIAEQVKLDEALSKIKDLEDREAAIIAKEIELGLREPVEEVDSISDSSGSDSSSGISSGSGPDDDGDDGSSHSDKASTDSVPSNLAQPHIDLANKYLKALRAVRDLIKPTDPQPDSGEIDNNIAVQHDQVLAEVWEIVDELT